MDGGPFADALAALVKAHQQEVLDASDHHRRLSGVGAFPSGNMSSESPSNTEPDLVTECLLREKTISFYENQDLSQEHPSAILRWQELTSALLDNIFLARYSEVPETYSKGEVRLRPAWIHRRGPGDEHPVGWAPSNRSRANSAMLEEFMNPTVRTESQVTLWWNCFGCTLLLLDILFIPVNALYNTEPSVKNDRDSFQTFYFNISVFGTAYWTTDLVAQCFLSVITDEGTPQDERTMRLEYLRSWFWVDICVVICDLAILSVDLIEVVGESNSSLVGSTRYLQATRLLRLLRLVRLLRLRRIGNAIVDLKNRLRTESLKIGLTLLQEVLCILLWCHYIACAWVALATTNDSQEPTWLIAANADGMATGVQYSMGLHWSLTQFSPSTNNIAPQNSRERVFAIGVVVFAFVAFSSFVSNVTNAVNHLRRLHQERYQQEAYLREFMREKGVTSNVRKRVNAFFRSNYDKRKRMLHSEDIGFISELPSALRWVLNYEIFAPAVLKSHLAWVNDMESGFFGTFCDAGVKELYFGPQQEIFVKGQASTGMYCLIRGGLHYNRKPQSGAVLRKSAISRSDTSLLQFSELNTWFAEAAPWVEWKHSGTMTTSYSAELYKVEANTLLGILQDMPPSIHEVIRLFAIVMCAYVEDLANLDLPMAVPVEVQDQAIRYHIMTTNSQRKSTTSQESGMTALASNLIASSRVNFLTGSSAMSSWNMGGSWLERLGTMESVPGTGDTCRIGGAVLEDVEFISGGSECCEESAAGTTTGGHGAEPAPEDVDAVYGYSQRVARV